jgi:23S rRNA pseudouridine955/2504/2580 synthase
MIRPVTLAAAADDDGRRLDRILRKALPDMPLSAIHSLLRKGRVLVDGIPQRGDWRVRAGSAIRIPLADAALPVERRGTPAGAAQSDVRDRVLWESGDFLVLNKPAGMAVHGPESGGSLEALARSFLAPKLPPSLSFRPGPLHRLDRPASGIIVFSKTLEGARSFSALLRERRVRKIYLALLEGILDREETWEDVLTRKPGESFVRRGGDPQGGGVPREARTRVSPLGIAAPAGAAGFTLARLEIDTGRTHQIRVQAAARGHPLAGDRKYGGAPQPGGFLLHARFLELPGGALPGLPPRLEAPLPDYFQKRLGELFTGVFAESL